MDISLPGNLYHAVPSALPDEITDCLLQAKALRIERIVSRGQQSPPGFWYDQPENEWVLVMKGEARLRFEDGHVLHLTEGAYVNIPAHRRHRVEWTAPDADTIWLAVFY